MANPINEVLPTPVIGFAEVQDGREVPLDDVFLVVGAAYHPAIIGLEVVVLLAGGVVAGAEADLGDMERRRDLKIHRKANGDGVRRDLGNGKGACRVYRLLATPYTTRPACRHPRSLILRFFAPVCGSPHRRQNVAASPVHVGCFAISRRRSPLAYSQAVYEAGLLL